MDAADETSGLELAEVATDGLGGHAETLGEIHDDDATLGRDQVLDELLLLRCVHLRPFRQAQITTHSQPKQ
ncbi:MAG: hypothetical protein U0Q04_08710 [Microbacterium sp.]